MPKRFQSIVKSARRGPRGPPQETDLYRFQSQSPSDRTSRPAPERSGRIIPSFDLRLFFHRNEVCRFVTSDRFLSGQRDWKHPTIRERFVGLNPLSSTRKSARARVGSVFRGSLE